MMSDELFYNAWQNALKEDEIDIFLKKQEEKIAFYNDEIDKELRAIHRIAHTDIKAIIKASGLNRTTFAQRYGIPLNTVNKWCSGARKCNDYIRLLLCKANGFI